MLRSGRKGRVHGGAFQAAASCDADSGRRGASRDANFPSGRRGADTCARTVSTSTSGSTRPCAEEHVCLLEPRAVGHQVHTVHLEVKRGTKATKRRSSGEERDTGPVFRPAQAPQKMGSSWLKGNRKTSDETVRQTMALHLRSGHPQPTRCAWCVCAPTSGPGDPPSPRTSEQSP